MPEKYLVIETSGRVGIVALAMDDRILAERRLDHARRHARDLAPAVQELLRAQGWRPADVAAVFVGRGPGSYTGLRVGLMSAKTFAYATGCAIVGIDAFPAIALQSREEWKESRLTVIADAQQEKVYAQTFRLPELGDFPVVATPLAVQPIVECLSQLSAGDSVAGPGLHLYRQRIPANIHVVKEELWEPRPASLLRIGLARLASGEKDDCMSLEPLYHRPSSAEENWDKK